MNPDGSPHYVETPQNERDIVEARLIKEKSPKPIEDLAGQLGVGVDVVHSTIDELREKGYGISENEGVMVRTKTAHNGTVFDASQIIDKHFIFGIAGDSHLSSKKERTDELEAMYDIFKNEGVSTVFHPGDITEGVGVYRGQELEVKHYGQEAQIEYAVATYPKRDGVNTYFITGNHDLRAYERGGVDPGPSIERQRPDMGYLGQATAEVLLPNGVKMELLHPAGGISYALSYKAQKYINNLAPQDVPDLMVWGHYHTSFYMHYRNVHFMQAPAFKDAGIWEKRLGLNPTIGGWIVEGHITDYGDVDRFKPELFTFDNSRR